MATIKCNCCGQTATSTFRHDYRALPNCKNGTFIDGGDDYVRFGGNDISLIEIDSKPVDIPEPGEMNCPYCGAPETTGGTVHGEGCWQAPKRSTVAVSRLPDAERLAKRIARHVTGEYEDDVVLVTALLREEGVAQ